MKRRNISFCTTQAILITMILFLSNSTNIIATSQSTAQEKVEYIIEELALNPDGLLIYVWGPVSAGEQIYTTKELLFSAPEKGYVIYIDLFPQANLFHPVQYHFIAEQTNSITTKNADTLPLNMDDYQYIETLIGERIKTAKNRRAAIPAFNQHSSIEKSSDSRWAVLLNGGHSAYSNYVRYWNDLSNIYISLAYTYGFLDEQIIVLCSDGLDPAPDQQNGQNSDPDLDGDGDDDIMYSCVLSNVDLAFTELAETVSPNDKIFVFQTDHGSSNGGWNTVFNLWNGEILTDAHFAELLAAFPPTCEIICTFEPCFSGGFLDDVVVPPGPVVASSACRHDEYSWAMNNLIYDEYAFYWTAAITGEDAFGNPADADYNEDGYFTMDEAFIFAETHDSQPESPQYGEYPEGIGSELTLFISNEPPEIPQKPDGPTSGIILDEYVFSSTTSEPENEPIYFLFDWGDNTTSNWIGPYESNQTVEATHAWQYSGEYQITVKAKDENGTESKWSEPHTIIMTKPTLDVRIITGGLLKISIPLHNTGDADAEQINYSITLEGGLILMGQETTGILPNLPAGKSTTIQSNPILGLGKTRVTVTVNEPKGSTDSRYQSANLLLFLVKVLAGGG